VNTTHRSSTPKARNWGKGRSRAAAKRRKRRYAEAMGEVTAALQEAVKGLEARGCALPRTTVAPYGNTGLTVVTSSY
jgi:hypothetical protein